jgi:hypothetical protein
MLWSTSSLLLFLVSNLHVVNASWWTKKSRLEEALHTDLEKDLDLWVVCRPATYPSILQIEDCYSALRFIDGNLKEQQWELIRNAPNRELGNPSEMNRVLGHDRFRLPAAVSHGSCLIAVDVHLGFSDDQDTRGEPRRPQIQLTTKQYFHIWGKSVKYATTEILTQCVRGSKRGYADASVMIDHEGKLDYSFEIFSPSGLGPCYSNRWHGYLPCGFSS